MDDSQKLSNSSIENGYLIHLVRDEVEDDFEAVEEFLLGCPHAKTAYVRINTPMAFCKLISSTSIETMDLPIPQAEEKVILEKCNQERRNG